MQSSVFSVIGADAVGLYPSLNTEVTSEAIRLECIDSEVEFVGINEYEAGKYLAMTCKPWELHKMGVGRLVPKRRHRKGPKPTITGEKTMSKESDETQWVPIGRQFSKKEKALVMGAMP